MFYCTFTDYPDAHPVPNKRLRLTSDVDDSLCYNGAQVDPGIGQNLSMYDYNLEMKFCTCIHIFHLGGTCTLSVS